MDEHPLIHNRPGLPAISYRIRDYHGFRAAMLARLAAPGDSRAPNPLRELTTRQDDDFGIALIDLWSYVADVLTFYQERTANEAYLGTARLPENVHRLVSLLGYRPAPGAGAQTVLAFDVQEPVPSAPQVAVPVGLRAQHVPGQDESPQKFETTESRILRHAWNRLHPVTHESQPWTYTTDELYLAGDIRSLSPGDAVLMVGKEELAGAPNRWWALRRITGLEPQGPRTRMALTAPLTAEEPACAPVPADPALFVLRRTASLFGSNAPPLSGLPEITRRQLVNQLFDVAVTTVEETKEGKKTTITTTSVVPKKGTTLPELPVEWPFGDHPPEPGAADLDGLYPSVSPATWVVLVRPGHAALCRLATVTTVTRTDFQLTAKVTRLHLESTPDRATQAVDLSAFTADPRHAVAHLEPEQMPLGTRPMPEPFPREWIEVHGDHTELEPGRLIVLGGTAAGTTATEVARLERTEHVGGVTRLFFAGALEHCYDRTALTVHANAVAAAHGESVREVLGDGDASRSFQEFTLQKAPLTYRVAAGAPHGVASTLLLRVNGVLWDEVRDLHGHGSDASVYTLRRAEDGSTVVQFGDGRTGRRLPTGRSNVEAEYRHGLGAEGNVGAGTITTLLDRPLGVKDVRNPRPAAGGADPENPDHARVLAPATVRTFGRIVSLRDFEDAARAHPGVAKARADLEWEEEQQVVRLTVAGEDGATITVGGSVHNALRADLDARRVPNRALRLRHHRPLPVSLTATIEVDAPSHAPEDVVAAVRTALRRFFSFDSMSLGGTVHRSHLYPVIHGVPGVLSADIDDLRQGSGDPTPSDTVTAADDQIFVLEDPDLTGIKPAPPRKETDS